MRDTLKLEVLFRQWILRVRHRLMVGVFSREWVLKCGTGPSSKNQKKGPWAGKESNSRYKGRR